MQLAHATLSGDSATQHGYVEFPRHYEGSLTAQLSDGPKFSEKLKHPGDGIRHKIYNVVTDVRYRMSDQERADLTPDVPLLLSAGVLPDATLSRPDLYELADCEIIETRWFNVNNEVVTSADEPGLYVAETTIRSKNTFTIHHYQGSYLPTDRDLQRLAAAHGLDTLEASREFLNDLLSTQDDAPAMIARLAFNHPYAAEELSKHLLHLRKLNGGTHDYLYNSQYPEGYDADSDKKWPAIIFLHGGGSNMAVQGVENSREEILKKREGIDLIGWLQENPQPYVVHQLSATGPWKPVWVKETIEQILAKDNIDPDRVILMGFSMGGMGTWNTISEYADMFAAAVPLAPRSGRPDQMHRLGKLPVWIFNGDIDWTTTIEDALKGEAALKAAGGDVRLTTLPFAGHGQTMHGAWNTPNCGPGWQTNDAAIESNCLHLCQ